ncbi:MAG: bacterial extracellular solute-binding family protein 6 [Achromobacter mucicolens]|jgi:iron(III) transport system substrate-binding protein|uniref:ABC transporter substrate-binding protein n=1 Tax=Achromobacter mucicolens TaxID=1389922 RepID=UPI0024308633|nr:ABC transporter substrate-binding protein [Achromobacter mucicolens]MDF2859831.1 bacterial extracellular solute-binding family protein 6 [Achromobacter mucicolens]
MRDALTFLRGLAASAALTLAAIGHAAEVSGSGLTLGPPDSSNVLVVHASNSVQVFRGVLEDFSRLNPSVRLEYTELSTQELYRETVDRAARSPGVPSGPDIVISSAMDLQTKLVNDGYARVHLSPQTRALPGWANWRDEVFSIGTDPIVMVYNTQKLDAARVPHTRRELLSLLQAPDQPLAGRISTYDVQGSGIGYLAATQDTRLDSMAGALLAAFGRNGVSIHESTEHALDKLESGEVTLAYNLLESYTRHRIDNGAPLAIIYPQDYTLMLSRSAIIPRQAPRGDLGALFLDYLLSARGQDALARESGMRPVSASVVPAAGVRPVALGVGLLVYLDPLKKRHFLDLWRAAIFPPR